MPEVAIDMPEVTQGMPEVPKIARDMPVGKPNMAPVRSETHPLSQSVQIAPRWKTKHVSYALQGTFALLIGIMLLQSARLTNRWETKYGSYAF